VAIGAELESDCVTQTNITPRQQLFAAINNCEAVGTVLPRIAIHVRSIIEGFLYIAMELQKFKSVV
jgi:hypothetical protein